MHESIVWVAHGSLHLIIDDAFVNQTGRGVIWVLELKAVALLSKIIIVKVGAKCHVSVDG